MDHQLEDEAARDVAAPAVALPPAPDDGGGADRGATGRTSLPGLDLELDRLAPYLARFDLSARRVVVEVDVGGRRVGIARPIPEGEHDLVAAGQLVLREARLLVEFFTALEVEVA